MARKSDNPFTPTFGHVPFAIAGRDEYIDDVVGGLANRPGDPNRATIFVGPRGTGKTVLMRAIRDIASQQGWVGASVSARKGMLDELTSQILTNASHILPAAKQSAVTSVQLGGVGVTRELYRESTTWRSNMTDIISRLNQQGVGVLFTVDELDPECEELVDFVDIYQYFVQEGRDVALLMAGLPGNVSALLQDKNVSFLRRAFQRPMERISELETEQAILETIEANGRKVENKALQLAARTANGFAYAIQLMGYYMWRQSDAELITAADARAAAKDMMRTMESTVFMPTLLELRPKEIDYLRAMAQDEGPSNTSEIAIRLGISMTNASNLRRRLMEYGVISEVRMGLVRFDFPLMKEYLREHPALFRE